MSETPGEYGTDVTQDDPVVAPVIGEEPAGDYEPDEQEGGTSAETGTTYDHFGVPEKTPNDERVEPDDLDDLTPEPNIASSAVTEDD